jgi:hypothetical protein
MQPKKNETKPKWLSCLRLRLNEIAGQARNDVAIFFAACKYGNTAEAIYELPRVLTRGNIASTSAPAKENQYPFFMA